MNTLIGMTTTIERRHKINKMREDNASDPDLESAELTLQINPNQITPEDLSDEDGDSEPTMNTSKMIIMHRFLTAAIRCQIFFINGCSTEEYL